MSQPTAPSLPQYLFSIGYLEYFFTNFPPAVKAMSVSTIFLTQALARPLCYGVVCQIVRAFVGCEF